MRRYEEGDTGRAEDIGGGAEEAEGEEKKGADQGAEGKG